MQGFFSGTRNIILFYHQVAIDTADVQVISGKHCLHLNLARRIRLHFRVSRAGSRRKIPISVVQMAPPAEVSSPAFEGGIA